MVRVCMRTRMRLYCGGAMGNGGRRVGAETDAAHLARPEREREGSLCDVCPVLWMKLWSGANFRDRVIC